MKKEYYKKLFIMKLKGAQKSEIWRQQIVQLLKDSLVQLYLQPDGSEATHFMIYDFIRTFSADPRRNQFKITLKFVVSF